MEVWPFIQNTILTVVQAVLGCRRDPPARDSGMEQDGK
jgi:hypothetical protein